MTIRKYKKKDLPQMRTLFYETVHQCCKDFYTPEELNCWAPPGPKQNRWLPAGKLTLVCCEGDKILGFVDMEKDGYVNRLYTHKNHQRQGIGRLLLESLYPYAKKWRLGCIKLEASRAAVGFYRHLGFLDGGIITRRRGSVVFENAKMIKFL